MIVNVIEDEHCNEIEVTVRCMEITQSVRILSDKIRSLDVSFHCKAKNENEYVLASIDEVYYFESIDGRTFVYFEKTVHECKQKLYELEELYGNFGFLRINKNTIVNIYKIKNIKPMLNRKFLICMLNGEQMVVNRHYVPLFKEKFNI